MNMYSLTVLKSQRLRSKCQWVHFSQGLSLAHRCHLLPVPPHGHSSLCVCLWFCSSSYKDINQTGVCSCSAPKWLAWTSSPHKAAISKYRETSKFMKKTGITAQLYYGTKKKKKKNSCSFFIIGIFHVLFEDCLCSHMLRFKLGFRMGGTVLP